MARYLHEIANDRDVPAAFKAEECLRALGELSGTKEDVLVDFRTAAQAYATLALVDALTSKRSGAGLADIVGWAGNVDL